MSALVIVGGGPRATGVLLALAAELRDRHRQHGPSGTGRWSADLDIHVVDPFAVGAGRIWRADQPGVLWMNSTADEITVYADGHVPGAAPVTGPDLATWIATATDRQDGPRTFIPRRDLAGYLTDAVSAAVAVLDRVPGVRFTVHAARVTAVGPAAVDSVEDGAENAAADMAGAATGRVVTLDDGTRIDADAVLLAQGHLDVTAVPEGPGHTPPGYTADTDWSHLHGGEDVIVRGFGLAFIDLMMLLTEGRGGRFTADGYVPSGREPVLWVGSGRGVPYRSKLTAGPLPAHLRYLPDAGDHVGPDGRLSQQILALLLDAELTLAWYTALADHHPRRTGLRGAELVRLVDAVVEAGPGTGGPTPQRRALDAHITRLVPDPADRFDPATHTAPLAGRSFAGRAGLEAAVTRIVAENLDRATGEEFRQDGALYGTLVAVYFALHGLAASGLVDGDVRQEFLLERVGSDFSYTCSGPPPERLANLLALHRAGIVRFLGPDLRVRVDERPDGADGAGGVERAGGFVASSPAVPGEVRAPHLVDARLARVDPAQVTDPLLRGLLSTGELTASAAGFLVDDADRVVDASGQVVGDLFLVGPSSSAQVPEAFGRPEKQGRVFAANARLAGGLLDTLSASRHRRSLDGVSEQPHVA